MTNKEAIKRLEEAYYNSDYMKEAIDLAIKALDIYKPLCPLDYPTEDDPYPVCAYKRPQGKWLHNSDKSDTLVCSVCNSGWDMWRYESKELKYCPNCGADMREADNEL